MKVENHYTVYMHIFPNGKRYIGITGQKPKERWRVHGNGYKPQKLMWRAIQKHGWENIRHIIVAENLMITDAGDLEKKLIEQYETNNPEFGYNQSTGGENSPIGVKRSEETRKKLSLSHIGQVGWNKGKHLSEETKEKLRKANIGKKLSEETKEKLRKANIGRKMPISAVQKTKEALNKPVICHLTGIVYKSATIAGEETGEPRNTITRHCRKEVRNPRWSYLN